MVGILIPFWDGLFSVAMLVLGSVTLWNLTNWDSTWRHSFEDMEINVEKPIPFLYLFVKFCCCFWGGRSTGRIWRQFWCLRGRIPNPESERESPLERLHGEVVFFRCATELMHNIPSQRRSQSNPEEILQQDSSFSTRASVQRRTSGPCLRRANQANGRCPQRCRKLLAWALSNQTTWPTTRSHLARTGNGGARLKPWSKGDYDPPLGDKVTAWRMGSQDL